MEKKRTLAVIPARGGSKGIPRKNIKPFLGKPLIHYTINLALSCPEIDKVIVSTDDDEIAQICKEAGADVPFKRPEELATDTCPSIPVIQHAVKFLEDQGEHYDNVLMLEPTAPLRTKKIVQDAILALDDAESETVVSVREYDIDFSDVLEGDQNNFLHVFLETKTTTRRQDTKNIYIMDAAVYGAKRAALMNKDLIMFNPYKEMADLKTKMVVSDPRVSVEIDANEHWDYAEYLYKKYQKLIEGEEE